MRSPADGGRQESLFVFFQAADGIVLPQETAEQLRLEAVVYKTEPVDRSAEVEEEAVDTALLEIN